MAIDNEMRCNSKISDITGVPDLTVCHLDKFTFEISACGNYGRDDLLIALSNYGERLAEDDKYIVNVGKDIILEFDNNLDQAVDEFVNLVLAMRGGNLVIDPPRRFGPIKAGGRVMVK